MAITSERAFVEKAIASLPSCPVEELYQGSPRVSDQLLAAVFEIADALLNGRDRLVWQKMRGLQSLDDYGAIHVAHGDLMFLLGVEYGRRQGGASYARGGSEL